MKKNKNLFDELTSSKRKYSSLVDEYRRIYQVGKMMRLNSKDTKLISEAFKVGVYFMLESLNQKIELNNLFSGLQISAKETSYQYIEVKEFHNHDKEKFLTIAMMDKNDNLVEAGFSIFSPSFLSPSVKLQFHERYKFKKTLFGLSDSYKKILLKKRCMYRSALLFSHIHKKLGLQASNWSQKIIAKSKKKGGITIN